MPNQSTPSPATKPLVAITTDRIERYGHPAHAVFESYVRAVSAHANALALSLPSVPNATDSRALIDNIDGLLLTGGPSNVAPMRYSVDASPQEMLLDPDRDATVLPVLKELVAAGVPILGVCRGFQEINVAWEGTLNPAVHLRPNALDHREGDHRRPIEHWYEDRHMVEIVPGGLLSAMVDGKYHFVNSLHHQGVEKLGSGLRVEAIAPDGLVEAFSVVGARSFAFAVQWHPEMRVHDSSLAKSIFTAFGAACRERRRQRLL